MDIPAMNDMKIRPARPADLPRLMELYAAARAFMRSCGNTVQWVGGYPSPELVAAGIAAGEQWVCVDAKAAAEDTADAAAPTKEEHIAATFWFAVGPEPTYAVITGGAGWLDDAPYGVVHRLASDGSRRGVGELCLGWALERCGNLRVDTHSSNTVMQQLLKRMNFTRCGEVRMTDGTPRDAYQRLF